MLMFPPGYFSAHRSRTDRNGPPIMLIDPVTIDGIDTDAEVNDSMHIHGVSTTEKNTLYWPCFDVDHDGLTGWPIEYRAENINGTVMQ